ncbi:SRPBCC family protein [Amycolatopsis sp. H20-H5]|uniref:SRPBCC family protein n=1 Tax=Amycolatopsis sp. H20-H5 TaxID=3046309 RepID=UPI002DBE1D23|nr:SRPBCC domain-containing protein [Amycolatopsis sp. H20-H5]MEC3976701.1 SRPBCC domain-containing protein [Amycolatopsis sp. H20-H5]
MTREFAIRKEVELRAAPEQVWEAIATGPGIDAWFMGPHTVEPGEGGKIRLEIGEYTDEATITAWEPGTRLAYRGGEQPDGTFHAFEYLIEATDGGTSVLRFVHHGFAGDDWTAEYDDMTARGWELYLHTLGQYLEHFPGRPATFVGADGPESSAAPEAWAVLLRALGLPGTPAAGARVRLAVTGLPPIDGVVDYTAPSYLGIRTTAALYRFHGRSDIGMSVGVGHHFFGPAPDSADSWRGWLSATLG